MAKKKNLNSVLADLEETKREQVLLEIRSIRMNSVITVLSIIGSLAAFVIIQKNNIVNFFKEEPTLKISLAKGIPVDAMRIELIDYEKKTIANTSLKSFPPRLELKRGNYEVKLYQENELFANEQFFLDYSENKTVLIPSPANGKLRLYVNVLTPHPQVQDEIKLRISSNGNGYIWIYETTGNNFRLLFPKPIFKDLNRISADQEFDFPNDFGLVAGDKCGKETYCFIMTTNNIENDAKEVLQLLHPQGQVKGEVKAYTKCWASKEFAVNVTK